MEALILTVKTHVFFKFELPECGFCELCFAELCFTTVPFAIFCAWPKLACSKYTDFFSDGPANLQGFENPGPQNGGGRRSAQVWGEPEWRGEVCHAI